MTSDQLSTLINYLHQVNKSINVNTEKLEEIRCGLIDIEDTSTEPKIGNEHYRMVGKDELLNEFRSRFQEELNRKTGWGRNEVMNLFNEIVANL